LELSPPEPRKVGITLDEDTGAFGRDSSVGEGGLLYLGGVYPLFPPRLEKMVTTNKTMMMPVVASIRIILAR
jgi:hypothetical protein